MLTKETEKEAFAIRFSQQENGKEVARAYLYILKNDLHKEPFGLLEDVFVDESQRGTGIGSTMIAAIIAEAKSRGCYKLIGTSRESRTEVHNFYTKLGLKKYGVEFRLDL